MKNILLITVASFALSGCIATKDFVREEVAAHRAETDDAFAATNAYATSLAAEIAANDSDIEDLQIQQAATRNIAARALAGKFVYKIVLTNDMVSFDRDSAELDDADKLALIGIVEKLIADNRGTYIQIEGHTDSRGSDGYNYDLGLKRAAAVRNYLASLGVPYHRMDVASMGESEPKSEIDEENRRVVIQIME